MRTLTLIILLIIWPSVSHAWQWRITERAPVVSQNKHNSSTLVCDGGVCRVIPKYQTPVVNDTLNAKSITDCPDGRCPLVKGSKGSAVQPGAIAPNTPTLAPLEPKVIVQARPVRSVMVKPVKRLFSGRIFSRLRCR